jgi:predicted DNA-binding protein
MRTTIDISEEQRQRLRQMATRRGVRGVSPLIREALERFLEDDAPADDALAAALAVQGALSSKDADELEATCRQVREQWR